MKYLRILFFLLFLSCTPEKPINDMVGNYTSAKMDRVERLYYKLGFGVNSTIIKTELSLKKNATFYFETCGIKTRGKWKVKDDLLILNVEQGKFKNDSLARIKKFNVKERKELFQFHIEKNKLFAIVPNSDGRKSILLLKKQKQS